MMESAVSHSKPRVVITYCVQCRWLLRAAWLAQEILSTFADDLAELSLIPGRAGIFTIYLNTNLIWDRKSDHGFPEAAVLKQRIRDQIDPSRPLGHCDLVKDSKNH